MQPGSVGSNDAQATPALGFKAGSEMFEQARPQGIKSLRGKPAPRLAEGPVTDFTTTTGLARQRGEQAIEFGLDAGAHSGEHQRQQAGKGERALAREGRRRQTRGPQKLRGEQRLAEPG